MSCEQRLITKEHIKINFFGLMNWLNTQVLKLFKSVKLYHARIITATLQASMSLYASQYAHF